MRNFNLLLVFLIVLGFQLSCYGELELHNVSLELDKIRKEVYACQKYAVKKNDVVIKCLNDAIAKYDTQIKYMIAVLEEILDEADFKKLSENQKEWENFMKKYNNLMEATFENTSADMPKLNAAGWKYRYTQTHAENLHGFYYLYVVFKTDGVI